MKLLITYILVTISICSAGRKFTTGFEITPTQKGSANTNFLMDGFTLGAAQGFNPITDPTIVRSGNQCGFTQSTPSQRLYGEIQSMSLTPPIYLRMWVRVARVSTGCDVRLAQFSGGGQFIAIYSTSANKISIGINGSYIMTSTGTMPANQNVLIKLGTKWASSTNWDTAYVNGELLTSTSPFSGSTTPNQFDMGCIDNQAGCPGTNPSVSAYFDDVAINDASGANENSWPDDTAHVLLSLPTSDNAIGGWRWGSNQTTLLYQQVNQVPFQGSTGVEVFNTVASATDNYDVNCQSYTVAGVPSGKQLQLVQAYCRHGEHSTNSTVNGSVALISNPTDGGEVNYVFGNTPSGSPAGHRLDDSTGYQNWVTDFGSPVYKPNIAFSSIPVVRVGKRTATTNQACIDFMGVLIEWTGSSISLARRRILNH